MWVLPGPPLMAARSIGCTLVRFLLFDNEANLNLTVEF